MIDILEGDCRVMLGSLAPGSVQCCITSPPYFALRDYGVDGQIGREQTPNQFIQQLIVVFRQVKRVLRDDGLLWVNLGDTYANKAMHGGIKPKDLIGVPWEFALEMRRAGWYLRRDVIWHKTNAMPESVDDRPASAHEYVFMFSKAEHYFYDQMGGRASKPYLVPRAALDDPNGRNLRSVWSLATSSYGGEHIAMFPPNLVANAIKVSTSEKGCCPACYAPIRRVVEVTGREKKWGASRRADVSGAETSPSSIFRTGNQTIKETVGWKESCTCAEASQPIPCAVLDPFGGAGTTSLVAERLGRDSIYIELNPASVEVARKRLAEDAPLFTEVEDHGGHVAVQGELGWGGDGV